ncbi:ABC transporter ATP-binding protein [Actinomyces minihominis]|uniref:ABC transporter ATP-binding protein n=1 Tax=Actinomyces minihominis TaxID=2002838 RepID=UPI000C0808B7|nr:ABC transporter ATP-binding protein [Actinomyces minihominis]
MLWRVTWPYLKEHWGQLLIVIALQVVATVSALFLPDLNASIIDEGVVTGDVNRVWQLGFIMLAVSAAQGISAGFAVYIAAKLAMGLGADLRTRVFNRVQDFSSREVHEIGAPSLITRSTNDVQQVQMVVLMIFNFMIAAPIMGVGGIIMTLRMNASLASLLIILVPVITAIIGVAFLILAPLFRSQQDRLDNMNTVLREELSGIRVIRAFVRQDDFGSRYTGANDSLRWVAMRIGTVFAVIFPLLQLVFSLGTIAVVWFGGHLVDSGSMEIGALLAFISYFAMIFGATMTSSMLFFMLPRAAVTSRRINEVLTTPLSITTPEVAENFPSGQVTFTLDDVRVQYPGAEEPVLHNINVDLLPNTTTAVIGSTGSGKSTFASLFPRLLDPSGGSVRANQTDVRELSLETLRDNIGFVPQSAYLFSGTIASTISGTDSPTEAERERIQWALDGAQATEFVSALEDGLDTRVDPGGRNFSGGQRQRLTMARALYKSADLYVFDDSFSALDYATDAAIRNSLRRYVGEAAVLIVAQRIATIRHADQILVLDNGEIVSRGRHEELVETSPTYRQIVESQMALEED